MLALQLLHNGVPVRIIEKNSLPRLGQRGAGIMGVLPLPVQLARESLQEIWPLASLARTLYIAEDYRRCYEPCHPYSTRSSLQNA